MNFCTRRRENVEIDVGREWVDFRGALLDDRQVTSPPGQVEVRHVARGLIWAGLYQYLRRVDVGYIR